MKWRNLLVLAGYLGLSILMTWPTARHLTTAIPGDGFDGWQNLWNLWWVREALLVQGSSPYYTDYLYAPQGVSLLFHTLNIFNGLWTLPLQLNFGLPVAYNSVVLLSFTLSGYGVYLLAIQTLGGSTTRHHAAAFVGGLVYTMSPFHFAHLLGHMQVFTMIWPPFYLLWLIRTLRPQTRELSPSPLRERAGVRDSHQTKNIILCTIFLLLTTSVALYHTLYLLIFTALALLWTLWQRRNSLRSMSWAIAQILLMGGLFALLLSPLLWPMIQAARARPDLDTGLAQNIALSADLLAFITPSEMHPLWGAWATEIANNFSTTTSERLIFVGFLPLALTLYIIKTAWPQNRVRFWAFISMAYFLLALGPYLHLNGRLITLGGWPVPLPYLLLYETVPFIGLTRSLSRYSLMLMIAMGVLVALALSRLSRRHRLGIGWPMLAGLLICFEFLAVPYPMTPVDTPPFFAKIARDPTPYTIAELPMNWDRPTPLLHQTTHRKRLLTAYTSRNNPTELAWRTPVFQQWRTLTADIIAQPLAEIAPTIFYDFNLRYVVLDYWQMPPGPEREATEKWVQAAMPHATPVYDDGRLRVYQTPPKTETHPYLMLGEGWQPLESDGPAPARPLSGMASLYLHHPPPPPLTLTLTLTLTEPRPFTATLETDGTPQPLPLQQSGPQQYQISVAWLPQTMAQFQLTAPQPLTISKISLTY